MKFIDTHIHLDGEEFAPDIDQVVERAREAGVQRMFLPAIDVKSCHSVLATCQRFPDLCFPMLGLHPEEVRSDWRSSLEQIKEIILSSLLSFPSSARLPVAFPLSSFDDFREAITPKHPAPDPDFTPRRYYQVYEAKHGFQPNLSILDLLFNMGPESIFWL